MDILKRIKHHITLKNVSFIALFLNIIALVFGAVYLVLSSFGIVYIFVLWDIFGVLMIVTFLNNFLLIYFNDIKLNKNTQLGNKLNILCYGFLIFQIFAISLIFLGNWRYYAIYSTDPLDAIRSYVFICIGYFGVLLFGMAIALIDIKNLNNSELWDLTSETSLKQSNKVLKLKKIVKKPLKIVSTLVMVMGLYISYAVIFGSVEIIAWVLLFLISGIFVFISFIFLSITLLFIKTTDKGRNPKKYKIGVIVGLLTTMILMMPLFSTPYAISYAEKNFANAFGSDWRDNIDGSMEKKYFLPSQYWIPGAFLSIPAKDCKYKADVEFFKGGDSNHSEDDDIELHFDVFYPKKVRDEMPGVKDGKSSILIVFHGGGHKWGSKGGQQIYMNKYFAAQGYVVYDVNYGLVDEGADLLPTPESVKGDFDVNDIMRHIGIFTQFISDPSNEYSADDLDADLDSTFVTGGSAGGHLTAATALGISSGEYPEIFGENITIKGMIPLYPGRPPFAGDDELVAPEEHLIDDDSPPCLIFQGTHDYGWEGSQVKRYTLPYKNEYQDADNDEICIIWFPFSGHASDVYRTGQYNQMFTYYMERFMYLCVEGHIE